LKPDGNAQGLCRCSGTVETAPSFRNMQHLFHGSRTARLPPGASIFEILNHRFGEERDKNRSWGSLYKTTGPCGLILNSSCKYSTICVASRLKSLNPPWPPRLFSEYTNILLRGTATRSSKPDWLSRPLTKGDVLRLTPPELAEVSLDTQYGGVWCTDQTIIPEYLQCLLCLTQARNSC
jgi:hypothetical protein